MGSACSDYRGQHALVRCILKDKTMSRENYSRKGRIFQVVNGRGIEMESGISAVMA